MELAHQIMILDTHQDTPYRLRRQAQDVSQRTPTGHFDYPRAKVHAAPATITAHTQKLAAQIMTEARALQGPLEETACRLHESNESAAARLLANYSGGVYLSVIEAMDSILRDTN